jgi:type 1 glutamine amidotransferase
MCNRNICGIILTVAVVLELPAVTRGQLTGQQAQRISNAMPQKARVAPKEPRRVLIWNTPFMDKCPHKGYCVPQAGYAMKLLGERTGAFEPLVSDDVAMYLPENLKRFDAIIFNNSNGSWIRPTEKDMDKLKTYGRDQDAVEKLLRRSLLDWVSQGGGIVAYHHAVGGNTHWPEFQELLGAGYWGHPWNEEVGIKLDEPDHPLLATFEGKDFRLAEEVFQFRQPYARDKLRVLLSLDTSKTNMSVPWIHRTDGDFGLAWIKHHGKGRVFYCAIGHRTDIWWNPKILRFYLDGIQFATGDLGADATASTKFGVEPGFTSLFNGRDLTGWRGNPKIWSVKDGVITGQTTPKNRVSENTFLIWTGGDPALARGQAPPAEAGVKDFELRLRYRIENGNSGIYFRSTERTAMHPEPLVGCQADFSADGRWTGVIMEYTLRGILAERGQKVVIGKDGKINVVGSVGEPDELLKGVKPKQWNDYSLIAKGGRIILKINDVVMCDLEDNDPRRIPSGRLALQVHQGPDMLVQFKDIRIRQF